MKFYRLSDATFYDRISTIYQFIKPFLDKKKMSIFEEYGAFRKQLKLFIIFSFTTQWACSVKVTLHQLKCIVNATLYKNNVPTVNDAHPSLYSYINVCPWYHVPWLQAYMYQIYFLHVQPDSFSLL